MRKLIWIGLIPLAVVLPHWITVVRTSPVDRGNIAIWGTIALILAVIGERTRRHNRIGKRRGHGTVASCFLAFALLVFIAGLVINIWLVSMVAAVGCGFFTVVFLIGWRRASLFIPAFAALTVSVPGVIFWGGRIGGIFAGEKGEACELRLSVLDGDLPKGWIVRRAEITPAEKALFRTSTLNNHHVAIGDVFIFISEVTMGDDEHEIHPPTFCLKSQGRTIANEESVKVDLGPGHPLLAVTETTTTGWGRNVVVWTWYTGASESTDSFVRFRMKAEKGWKRYTLTATDTPESREAFQVLIRSIL